MRRASTGVVLFDRPHFFLNVGLASIHIRIVRLVVSLSTHHLWMHSYAGYQTRIICTLGRTGSLARSDTMNDVLIFSKDRAAQLDLLLRSIQRHAPCIYSTVTVLYRGTNQAFSQGYTRCFSEHAPTKFVLETDFEADTRRWLSFAGEHVSFLVDDDVFYRDALAPRTLPWSFRGGDYDYPLSVDGNVYEHHTIQAVLAVIGKGWHNPTQLEARMHGAREAAPFTSVIPCEPPCLAGLPWNRVSQSSGMAYLGPNPDSLNRAYLNGHRLDLDLIGAQLRSQVPAAHMNVQAAWESGVAV